VSTTFESLEALIRRARLMTLFFAGFVRVAEFAAKGPTLKLLVDDGVVVGTTIAVVVVVVEDAVTDLYSDTQSTCIDTGVVGQAGLGVAAHHVCC
jgi:hypothetical protein